MKPSGASSSVEAGVDVLIVGGGVIGSSVAHFLSSSPEGRDLKIAVVERDPTYRTASTSLSVGGVRQQFSTPENVLLSRFSVDFFRKAGDLLSVRGEAPELGFREEGYLFLATEKGRDILEENREIQTRMGAPIELLEPDELRARFPWLETGDLAAGALGREGEGWLDPHSLLQALRAKAREGGVAYLEDEVTAVSRSGSRVDGVELKGGNRLGAGWIVNAAGPRAGFVAKMAGIHDLPVRSRKRFVFRFSSPLRPEGCPLVVDPSGVYFRPEGDGFLSGVSPSPGDDPDTLDLSVDHDLFHRSLWPILAARVPAFDTLRMESSWAGHYAFNTVDQNAIVGPHPDLPNFMFANGFSGHGLQHAPGVGRAVAELILFGEYRSLDLERLSFSRFAAGRLLREGNVV